MDHFASLLEHLSDDEASLVKKCYTEDKNTIPCSFHLNGNVNNNNNNNNNNKNNVQQQQHTEEKLRLRSLLEVYEKLFQKENLERALYEQFLPGK